MKAIDLTQVEDRKEFAKVVAGGYVAKIESVKDVPEKEYLLIEYDFAEGQLKGYYADLFESKNFWGGKFVKSYKDTALSFFKGFITAVAKSNPGFAWTSNEQQLVGKRVGIVIGIEEYLSKTQTVEERPYVADIHSVEAIKNGNFKVPPLKALNRADAKSVFRGTEVSL